MSQQMMYQLGILALFIIAMYFLLIRPQKKKEKEVTEMRNSITAGDEIVTIGGIHGKIMKVKDETMVIQVGSDKTKMEIAKWAVSTVIKKTAKQDAEPAKKAMPKKLSKASAEKTEDVETEAK